MKYLRDLPTFRAAQDNRLQIYKEAFSNEVTWGGSLVGRLINSSIRWLSIRYKATKVDSLVEEFRAELDKCLNHYVTADERTQIASMRLNFLLNQIYQISTQHAQLVNRLILLLSQSQIRGGGVGVLMTNSYQDNNVNYYKKIFEEKDNTNTNNSEDGLIQIAINDAKKSNIQDKAELIDKLEAFRDELLKIEYPEITKEELQNIDTEELLGFKEVEDDKKEESDTESQKKFPFYSNTRMFLESYLNLHDRMKSDATKTTGIKKDSLVMWVIETGENKGKYQFGKIIEEPKSESDVFKIQPVKKEKGKPNVENVGQTVQIKKEKVKSLIHFDENRFNKLSETNIKDIKIKIEEAKRAYYTFYQSKNQSKANFYAKRINQLNTRLSDLAKKQQTAPTSQETNQTKPVESEKQQETLNSYIKWGFYDTILESESATDEMNDKKTWVNVSQKFSQIKQEVSDKYQKHLDLISELLKGKLNGKDDGKLSKKFIRRLGKQIMIEIKEKYPKLFSNIDIKQSENKTEGIDDTKVTALAQVVVKFLVLFLSLKDNSDFSTSMKNEKKEDLGKIIDKMLTSYNGMIEAYKNSIKENNSRILTKYSNFRLLNEANDSDDEIPEDEIGPDDKTNDTQGENELGAQEEDLITKAWYKVFDKGEEKKWKVDESEIRNFKTELETKGVTIDVSKKNESYRLLTEADDTVEVPNPEHDPIMRIVDVFGKAYKLYATEYIPSGRPGGRVSQRTLREYEYIGTSKDSSDRTGAGGEGTDYYTPGKGPWAALKVFEKWRDGVNSIIEKREYRRILANINYVGGAELDTGTRQQQPAPDASSGVTLLRFIDKMMNLRGTFKEAASELYRKYFNADLKEGELPNTPRGDGGSRPNPNAGACSEEDRKPYLYPTDRLTNMTRRNLKVNGFYFMQVRFTASAASPTCPSPGRTAQTKYWLVWVYKIDTGQNGRIILRVQESDTNTRTESMITPHFTAAGQMDLINNPGPGTPTISHQANKDVFLLVLNTATNLQNFDVRQAAMNGHRIRLNQAGQTDATSLDAHVRVNTNWQACSDISISEMYMVVTNCNGTNTQNNTPTLTAWVDARKASQDLNISNNVINNIQTP